MTKLLCLLAMGIVFAGCNQLEVSRSNPSQPAVTPVVQSSSGDPNQDLTAIEAELDDLDLEADFPALSDSDLAE